MIFPRKNEESQRDSNIQLMKKLFQRRDKRNSYNGVGSIVLFAHDPRDTSTQPNSHFCCPVSVRPTGCTELIFHWSIFVFNLSHNIKKSTQSHTNSILGLLKKQQFTSEGSYLREDYRTALGFKQPLSFHHVNNLCSESLHLSL